MGNSESSGTRGGGPQHEAPNPYGAGYVPPPRYMTPDQLHVMMMRGNFYAPLSSGFAPPPIQPCRMENATAIRNDVNVKKGTLRFVESASHPGRLFLEFDFDANTSCAITVCYGIIERLEAGSTLTASVQPARGTGPSAAHLPPPSLGLRRVFPPGLNQHFSQAVDCIDGLTLARFSKAELSNAPVGPSGAPSSTGPPGSPAIPHFFFPVLIVLESAPDSDVGKVAPAGPDVACGKMFASGNDSSVHLQCTYAAVTQAPAHTASPAGSPPCLPGTHVSREWAPRTLKQKIRVGGMSYELREIYGIDGGSKAATAGGTAEPGSIAAEEVLQSGSECVICLTEPRDTTVLPCRHMCMCSACAQQLSITTKKCPVCRAQVQSLLRIRLDAAEHASTVGPSDESSNDHSHGDQFGLYKRT